MKKHVLLMTVAAVISVGHRAAAEEPTKKAVRAPEAVAILEKAAAAIKRTPAFTYDADYVGTEWVAEFVPKAKGKAVVGKQSEYDVDRFRSDVTLELPAKEGEEPKSPLQLTAGSDGDTYYLVDAKSKTVYADMDAAVMGSHSRDVQRIVMGVFGAATPFDEELKSEHIEIHGTRKVGTEACDEILVTLDGDSKMMWFVGKRDGLPRGIERFYKNREGVEGTTRLLITNLKPVASPTPDLFAVRVPEGFRKTDEFAP